jgi:hypothetical protein
MTRQATSGARARTWPNETAFGAKSLLLPIGAFWMICKLTTARLTCPGSDP